MVVSGRISTLVKAPMVNVGQTIPETYSGNQVRNTEGFSWWVSQHFALKTDLNAETARHFLELLELSYPHYVETFGGEPPGIERKRMAFVYASSGQQLVKAMASDGMEWNQGATGGITYEGRNAAYAAPEGAFVYFKRYVLIHEGAHLFQICLNSEMWNTPVWYFEGIADSVSQHVWEASTKHLTVHVLDKMTNNNYYGEGVNILRSEQGKGLTPHKVHLDNGAARGINLLMVHYFTDDPLRAQKFRIWRDELFRLALRGSAQQAASDRLLRELFGSWEEINAGFAQWFEKRQHSFEYVDWGWEQDGNTLWSYGFPLARDYSQTDAHFIPAHKPNYDPLRMDYPAAAMPSIVGPVERGVPEPSVGAVIDFSRCPDRGFAGIGLGVVEGEIVPFHEDALFLDEGGKEKGLDVAVHELASLIEGGKRPEQVKRGKFLGKGRAAGITLGPGNSAPVIQGRNEQYVAEWNGWLRAGNEAQITFATSSDDGSWLWIDGKEVVSNGGPHGMLLRHGAVKLEAGLHRLRVLMFQGGGGAGLVAGTIAGDSPGFFRLLIEKSRALHLDGTDLGISKVSLNLPGDLREAMAAGSHRIGMTARIARSELQVTLRARDPQKPAVVSFSAKVQLTADQRRRLLSRHLTILARDGWHGITPWFDDRRTLEPDFSISAPANRWRNPGDKHLYGLVRATWILGDHVPSSLRELQNILAAGANQSPDAQRKALDTYESSLGRVLEDILECEADEKRRDQALAAIAGLSLRLKLEAALNGTHIGMTASLKGPVDWDSTGNLVFESVPPSTLSVKPAPEPLRLKGSAQNLKRTYLVKETGTFTVRATTDLHWKGQRIRLEAEETWKPSISSWWVIGPFDNPGGGRADIKHSVEAGPIDIEKSHNGADGKVTWQRVMRPADLPVMSEHRVSFASLFGERQNVAAYAFADLRSEEAQKGYLVYGSDDGAVVWLNRQRIHTRLASRGYTSKSDRVAIDLKKGHNRLLFKITQDGGPWEFCAHLEDETGRPMQFDERDTQ